MVAGEHDVEVAGVRTHQGPTVTHIRDVDHVIHEQRGYRTGAALVQHVDVAVRELLHRLQEVGLSILETVDNSLFGVIGELGVADDELMKVIAEEVGAAITAMAVKHPEESALRPVLALLRRRLHDVEDDADSVLVVIPDDPLVSIRCVS